MLADPILENFKMSLCTHLRAVDAVNRGVEFYSGNVAALFTGNNVPDWLDISDLSEETSDDLKIFSDKCPNPKILLKLLKNIKLSFEPKEKKDDKKVIDLIIPEKEIDQIILDDLPNDMKINVGGNDTNTSLPKTSTEVTVTNLHINWLPTTANLTKAQKAKTDGVFPQFNFGDCGKELGLEYDSEASCSDAIDALKGALNKKEKLPKNMNSLLIFIEDISLSLVIAGIWSHGDAYNYRRQVLEVGQQTKSTRACAIYDKLMRGLFCKVSRASKSVDWAKLTGEICQKSLMAAKNIEESHKTTKKTTKGPAPKQGPAKNKSTPYSSWWKNGDYYKSQNWYNKSNSNNNKPLALKNDGE
jgi:hypothetical protein